MDSKQAFEAGLTCMNMCIGGKEGITHPLAAAFNPTLIKLETVAKETVTITSPSFKSYDYIYSTDSNGNTTIEQTSKVLPLKDFLEFTVKGLEASGLKDLKIVYDVSEAVVDGEVYANKVKARIDMHHKVNGITTQIWVLDSRISYYNVVGASLEDKFFISPPSSSWAMYKLMLLTSNGSSQRYLTLGGNGMNYSSETCCITKTVTRPVENPNTSDNRYWDEGFLYQGYAVGPRMHMYDYQTTFYLLDAEGNYLCDYSYPRNTAGQFEMGRSSISKLLNTSTEMIGLAISRETYSDEEVKKLFPSFEPFMAQGGDEVYIPILLPYFKSTNDLVKVSILGQEGLGFCYCYYYTFYIGEYRNLRVTDEWRTEVAGY